jgi:hypothetical protein
MAGSDPLDLAALLLKGVHDGHDPEVVRRAAVIAYRVELGLDTAPASLVVQVLVSELARSIAVDAFAPAALLGAFRVPSFQDQELARGRLAIVGDVLRELPVGRLLMPQRTFWTSDDAAACRAAVESWHAEVRE